MALYELWVLCRREPPPPPDGWGSRVLGIDTRLGPIGHWAGQEHDELVVDETFRVELYLKRDDSRPTGSIMDLARVLADAGDGVVLRRMPVTLPPVFRVEHAAIPFDAPTWASIEARLSR